MEYTIDLPDDIDNFTIEYNNTKQSIRIQKNEERIPVKVYKVKKICLECGGEMIATGKVKLTFPLPYLHKCENCGYKMYYSKEYPYIDYKEEE